jgi:hypothetical protein
MSFENRTLITKQESTRKHMTNLSIPRVLGESSANATGLNVHCADLELNHFTQNSLNCVGNYLVPGSGTHLT